MYLKTLTVEHVRNLENQTLYPGNKQNLIIGPNASGKTSLLEAIHFLCLSRSFRTHRIEHVITRGFEQLQVTGELYDPRGERKILIGVAKGKTHFEIHVDRHKVQKLADLSRLLPVVVLNPEAHELLEQGPKQRRQFVDWGLFHVEPQFLAHWQNFYRVLRQRNAALRVSEDIHQARAWNPEYIKAASQLHQMRESYLDQLQPYLRQFCELLLDQNPEFSYRPGWNQNIRLQERLSSQEDQDLRRGFTHSGPHRADLEIIVNGSAAQAHFSRGQQKLLVCAMRLAQAALMKETGKTSLLLVDDLPSELDWDRRSRLLQALKELDVQSFITATDADAIPDNGVPTRAFHVKQGRLENVV